MFCFKSTTFERAVQICLLAVRQTTYVQCMMKLTLTLVIAAVFLESHVYMETAFDLGSQQGIDHDAL